MGQQQTAEQVKRLRSDVDDMKNRPAKQWELVVTTVLGALVGYMVKLLLSGV